MHFRTLQTKHIPIGMDVMVSYHELAQDPESSESNRDEKW